MGFKNRRNISMSEKAGQAFDAYRAINNKTISETMIDLVERATRSTISSRSEK